MPISLWQRPSSSDYHPVSPFSAIAEPGPRLAIMLLELAPGCWEQCIKRRTDMRFYKWYTQLTILWGCVRATRSLHDEVPGIWFTSWPLSFLIFLQLLLSLLFPLLYFYSTSSSIVAVLIAIAGPDMFGLADRKEFLLYILSLTLQQVCYC